jgi:hypothetical protein
LGENLPAKQCAIGNRPRLVPKLNVIGRERPGHLSRGIMRKAQVVRTPADIFPNIDVPVIAVGWRYTGRNGVGFDGVSFLQRVEKVVSEVFSVLVISHSLERQLILALTEDPPRDKQVYEPARARLSRT